ncbi:MAG: hypothetical protein K0R68_2833 [Mycobacterium sp.]|nr:hypothetical protein [Mycobacterium sp.]
MAWQAAGTDTVIITMNASPQMAKTGSVSPASRMANSTEVVPAIATLSAV